MFSLANVIANRLLLTKLHCLIIFLGKGIQPVKWKHCKIQTGSLEGCTALSVYFWRTDTSFQLRWCNDSGAETFEMAICYGVIFPQRTWVQSRGTCASLWIPEGQPKAAEMTGNYSNLLPSGPFSCSRIWPPWNKALWKIMLLIPSNFHFSKIISECLENFVFRLVSDLRMDAAGTVSVINGRRG